ncbi:MAG: M3 family oligoendopeptidase, partial [Armatimonadetes bacterium]|nr:M3 family oligoendopeptidase [Candidatus Hippobium faecium]
MTEEKWDLSPLYTSEDNIEKDLAEAKRLADDFEKKYRGKIKSPSLVADILYNAIKDTEKITRLVYRPDMYAALKFSADTGDPKNGKLMQAVQEKVTEISVKTMFFELELMEADENIINSVLADPRLAEYRHFVKTARVFNDHKLTEACETIMEEKANTGSRAWDRLFDEVLSSAEFRIEIDGEEKILNEPGILAYLKDPDRDVRIKAGKSLTEGLLANSKVLTFIFNTLVNDKAINDRLRKYSYPQESRHKSNELSKNVVDLVIKTCTENYDMVSRFYKIKKEILGLPELTHVDRYAPLALEEKPVSYEEAKEIILSAFGSFSDRFRDIAQDTFTGHWIDAEPRQGKRGGAFCMSGIPEINPFILCSYLDRQDDVMTLAHELGHGIHAVLSSEQNIFNYEATLPVCENASTFGEMLVFEKLVAEASLEEKLALYAAKIESIFATIFRQAAMYLFESDLHRERREKGELTCDEISALWQKNIQAMFGDSLILGEEHKYWWLYVSHFIGSPFYVYAYSFGELMVLALFGLYKKNPKDFVPKYIKLLSMGGSVSPEDLLREVGFDINTPEFWNRGIAMLDSLMTEFEAIYKAWKNNK